MGSDEVDEREAWQLALGGDGQAFAVLFDAYHPRVLRHVVRISGRSGDAEDLAAAAFLELWRRRDSVRLVEGSVLPWLLVTASNVARNAGRAQRRYARLLSTLPPPEDAPDFADGVLDDLDTAQRSAVLTEALRTLPRIDQDLLTLTAFEGVSLQAASTALGLTYGAAKTRLSRARRRLGLQLDHPAIHGPEIPT